MNDQPKGPTPSKPTLADEGLRIEISQEAARQYAERVRGGLSVAAATRELQELIPKAHRIEAREAVAS